MAALLAIFMKIFFLLALSLSMFLSLPRINELDCPSEKLRIGTLIFIAFWGVYLLLKAYELGYNFYCTL